MAINLYLAQKYEGPMHCASPEAVLETEALLLDLLQHRAVPSIWSAKALPSPT
jgi:glutathione S-transferase